MIKSVLMGVIAAFCLLGVAVADEGGGGEKLCRWVPLPLADDGGGE